MSSGSMCVYCSFMLIINDYQVLAMPIDVALLLDVRNTTSGMDSSF